MSRVCGLLKIIVGLGNPGKEYEKSRHNFGFWAVEFLAESYAGERFKKTRLKSEISLCGQGEHRLVLAKPATFMNLSGEAVAAILGFFKCSVRDLLVVHDDLDLPLGRIKWTTEGSSGGHRGIESIIEGLNTKTFNRLRLGIGRPPPTDDAVDYVLSPFFPEEEKKAEEVLEKVEESVSCYLSQGLNRTMELYNRRP